MRGPPYLHPPSQVSWTTTALRGSCGGWIRRLRSALPTQLTLDLSGVTFMDSSGIALLIRARQRMQELGGTADVCGAAAQARRVLDAAGLQRYLTIR